MNSQERYEHGVGPQPTTADLAAEISEIIAEAEAEIRAAIRLAKAARKLVEGGGWH